MAEVEALEHKLSQITQLKLKKEAACMAYANQLEECLDQRIVRHDCLVAITNAMPASSYKQHVQKVLEQQDAELGDWEACLFRDSQHGKMAVGSITSLMPNLSIAPQITVSPQKKVIEPAGNTSKPQAQCPLLTADCKPVTTTDAKSTTDSLDTLTTSKFAGSEAPLDKNTFKHDDPIGYQKQRRQGKPHVRHKNSNIEDKSMQSP